MTSTDQKDFSDLFPTVIHVQDDIGISPSEQGSGHSMGASADTGRTVHVGDIIRFTCQGADPRGRELAWWLDPYGEEPTARVVGTRVELTWRVGRHSVGRDAYLGIGMAADAPCHREGGHGVSGWDGWVRYLFTVLP